MKKYMKPTLAVIILLATVFIIVRYMNGHPEILEQLKKTNPWVLAVLVGLYCIWSAALVWVLVGQLKVLGKKLAMRENILLNSYSSLVNFFGPGQSGPGVRAVYLKAKHAIRLRDFTFVVLLYYGCYAVISAAFLFAGSRPWWQTALLVGAAGTGSFVVIRWFAQKSRKKESTQKLSATVFNFKAVGIIFASTLLQLTTQAIIYGVELHSVGQDPSIGQIISYTGAANFALFVSITPGAIGIREAFLAFSTSLHGIDNAGIVAANVIDRAAYLLFLGILFIVVGALHAKKHLAIKSATASEAAGKDDTLES